MFRIGLDFDERRAPAFTHLDQVRISGAGPSQQHSLNICNLQVSVTRVATSGMVSSPCSVYKHLPGEALGAVQNAGSSGEFLGA